MVHVHAKTALTEPIGDQVRQLSDSGEVSGGPLRSEPFQDAHSRPIPAPQLVNWLTSRSDPKLAPPPGGDPRSKAASWPNGSFRETSDVARGTGIPDAAHKIGQVLAATLSAHESAVFGVHVSAGLGDAGWPVSGSGAAGGPAGRRGPGDPGLWCVLAAGGSAAAAPFSARAGGQCRSPPRRLASAAIASFRSALGRACLSR